MSNDSGQSPAKSEPTPAPPEETLWLYRFVDPTGALKTIERRRFRVGRLNELNDPFEFRLGFNNAPNEEARAIVQRAVDALISQQHAWIGFLCFSATVREPVLWSHYAAK